MSWKPCHRHPGPQGGVRNLGVGFALMRADRNVQRGRVIRQLALAAESCATFYQTVAVTADVNAGHAVTVALMEAALAAKDDEVAQARREAAAALRRAELADARFKSTLTDAYTLPEDPFGMGVATEGSDA